MPKLPLNHVNDRMELLYLITESLRTAVCVYQDPIHERLHSIPDVKTKSESDLQLMREKEQCKLDWDRCERLKDILDNFIGVLMDMGEEPEKGC